MKGALEKGKTHGNRGNDRNKHAQGQSLKNESRRLKSARLGIPVEGAGSERGREVRTEGKGKAGGGGG